MKRFRRLLLAAIAVTGGSVAVGSSNAEAQGSGRCYMAFIHGSGDKFHDEDAFTSEAIARYWSNDGSDGQSFVYYAARIWAGDKACLAVRVGYDGNQQWWHERAAGKVAATLNDFIKRHDIPDGKLILVGHSMGGVLARYLVNNGVPHAPFYNEYAGNDARMSYDLVRRKTAHIISVQSPHAGTQAADSLYGQADHRFTRGSAGVVKMFDLHETTAASSVLTRAYMEAAGAPGGEMADEGRAITIYSIGGVDTGDASGVGSDADGDLDLAWILLCYKKGARNSWGALCRWDPWNFRAVAGDGLVETASAHGRWMRASPNGRAQVGGAWQVWLDVVHNHNQGRFDIHSAAITDHLRSTRTTYWLGSYVGSFRPGVEPL
jgi:pimeloyl-ACP methyl ester carboxylesterase